MKHIPIEGIFNDEMLLPPLAVQEMPLCFGEASRPCRTSLRQGPLDPWFGGREDGDPRNPDCSKKKTDLEADLFLYFGPPKTGSFSMKTGVMSGRPTEKLPKSH